MRIMVWLFSVWISILFPLARYNNVPGNPFLAIRKSETISCAASSAGNIDTTLNGKFMVPLPGWGNYAYHISSNSDSAQFYVNQGLSMYYSYHQKEAVASFKEASRFDSLSAISYWGQALALGPGYNTVYVYALPKTVSSVLHLMNKAATTATEKEKRLIAAMNRRYVKDPSDNNIQLYSDVYAREMKTLLADYPGDVDIKALYIDAVMLIHPWDFWNNNGSPKPWTNELITLCEEILKVSPTHPAALHYYIHLTEASHHPEAALENARALEKLFPGVAHMVHMASHEYERNGQYSDGVAVNEKADSNLIHYTTIAGNLGLNKHSPHYFAVQTYCAFSGGMYQKGIQSAILCRNSVTPTHDKTYEQYLYMMPSLTLTRLGKWKEILADTTMPSPELSFALILHHFAKGLALVNAGNINAAKKELSLLRNNVGDTMLAKKRVPFNSPLQSAGIVENILDAAILFSQKKYNTAFASLNKAIQREDKMIYAEPKDWPIPARQFLGAYLLKLKKPALAEKIYREDLVWNPGNGWSLLGLCQSLAAQHKTKAAATYKMAYLRSFSHAEQLPPASAYLP